MADFLQLLPLPGARPFQAIRRDRQPEAEQGGSHRNQEDPQEEMP